VEWGDKKIGVRGVLYDDIKNDHKVVESLTAMLKADATDYGRQLINKKGGAMVEGVAVNYSGTTNYLRSIPLDDSSDRRIHPIELNAGVLTDEDRKRLSEIVTFTDSDYTQYYPLIQKVLNHLFYIYNLFKDRDSTHPVMIALHKRIPNSKLIRKAVISKSSAKKRFVRLCETATSKEVLYQSLVETYTLDESAPLYVIEALQVLKAPNQISIIKRKGKSFLFINGSTAVKQIGDLINYSIYYTDIAHADRPNSQSANAIGDAYFRDEGGFKGYDIDGKTKRGILIEMLKYKGEEGGIYEAETEIIKVDKNEDLGIPEHLQDNRVLVQKSFDDINAELSEATSINA
jgi:hypothetical protein